MSDALLRDAMFDTYIYETTKQLESLETIIMKHEESTAYANHEIDEIFRIMHTIKGASGMMGYGQISNVAHSVEDLFCLLRNKVNETLDYVKITDLVLDGLDYIKEEVHCICCGREGQNLEGIKLIDQIRCYMTELEEKSSPCYKATLFFEECHGMEDLRAFEVINQLKGVIENYSFEPDVTSNMEGNADLIRDKGFLLTLETEKSYDEIKSYLENLLFVQQVKLDEVDSKKIQVVESIQVDDDQLSSENEVIKEIKEIKEIKGQYQAESYTSVSFDKLDKIMNLLGEMVVAESMVLENPDLVGLNLNHFNKAARQLSKITAELQDEIISMRLVPIGSVFQKMHRVVRDLNKKLNKKVKLNLIGEETEIDKKVVDYIMDPIMHMVRNAIDHGIETIDERRLTNKKVEGNLNLEAKNEGGEVFIKIVDDGKGLNKENILAKAKEKGLVGNDYSPMSDQEVYELIFKPGFSTKEYASEFSGRGVGMDVVRKNIETIGGSIYIDSVLGEGTTFTIKIPLTMAIIDGMTLRVGKHYYTVPIRVIKESFRPNEQETIIHPNGTEMLFLRGEGLPVIRLYERYQVETDVHTFKEGIVVRLEQNGKSICLFVDEIMGQQQVVIKTLPKYILNMNKVKGISGCTLLGDGTISLILDFEGLLG